MPSVEEEPTVIEKTFYEVENALRYLSTSGIYVVAILIALFALYSVHTLTTWLSGNPEQAFHRGKLLVAYASTGWNTATSAVNVVVDSANMLLPYYNALVMHTVQPVIWTGLEVASIVFFHKHYTGIITEDLIPFEGHDCSAPPGGNEDPLAQQLRLQWCGDIDQYAQNLGVVESTGSSVVENGTHLLLNTGVARRLQSLVTQSASENPSWATPNKLSSGKSLLGVLPIEPLLDTVLDITGVLIELVATGADVFFDVVYTILEEQAVLVFNIIMTILNMVAQALMQLIRSGILQSVLTMGADILTALVFHVALPLLLAVIDVFMCILNLMQPGTWGLQLQCIEKTCFQESGDIGAEIFTTFSSIPIVTKQIGVTVESLLNPATGRRYSSSTSGGTTTPVVDVGQLGNAAATTCAACFSCKVPELRAIWLLIAMTVGCIKDESKFPGRVEQH